VRRGVALLRRITLIATWALCQDALAQTIYKCGIDGKIEYQQQPCADGKGAELAPPAAPEPERRASAQLERDKAQLARIEHERAATEARAQKADQHARRADSRAQGTSAHKKQHCDRLRLRLKWAEQDQARAVGPRADALELKARRQAESLALECPA
jgi:hypothetical protein